MLVWQFSNIIMYIRVHEKMPDQNFKVLLFSNPGEKVLILVKSRGQICPLLLGTLYQICVQQLSFPTLVYLVLKLIYHYFTMSILREQTTNSHHNGGILPSWKGKYKKEWTKIRKKCKDQLNWLHLHTWLASFVTGLASLARALATSASKWSQSAS